MSSCQIYNSWFYLLCFLLLSGITSSSPFVSNVALDQDHGVSTRNLLQQLKKCNVSFQDKDYSVLTKNCRGPQYPKQPCCDALKEFSCPFADQVNDLQSDCAPTMFSYITLYGKYPPGLFANMCKEGKEGLDCSQVLNKKKSSSARTASNQSLLIVFLTCILGFFLQFL